MTRGVLVFLIVVVAQAANAQLALIDHAPNQLGASVVAQQFEPSLTAYNAFAAEDLVVPAGQNWHLDSVIVYGEYASPFGTPVPGAGIIISVHQNNSGQPGAVIFTDTTFSGADLDEDGSLFYAWTAPLSLTPGTYWLVVAARKDLGSSPQTQWQWFSASSTTGDTALWVNPGGGFTLANCPTWNQVTTCYGSTNPGLSFTLFGCPQAKPTIVGLPLDTTFCSNEGLSLVVAAAASMPVYAWSNGQQGNELVVDSSGVFSLTVTDGSTGCSVVDSVEVVEIQVPELDFSDTAICPETAAEMGVDVCTTCTILWSTSQTTSSIAITEAGVYWAVVTDSQYNCTSADTFSVSLFPTDPLVWLPSSAPGFCEGDGVELGVASAYGAYQWSNGETSATTNINEQQWVALVVTDSNDCFQVDSVFVQEYELPEPNILMNFSAGSFVLTLQQTYTAQQWFNGSGAASTIANVPMAYVTVTDSNGCVGTDTIQVPLGVGLLDRNESKGYVYPVPTTDFFNLGGINGVTTADLTIFTPEGRHIKDLYDVDLEAPVFVGNLPKGMYFLRIETTEKIETTSFIKQ